MPSAPAPPGLAAGRRRGEHALAWGIHITLENKALLQMASAIGKDVPFVLLQAIGEHAEDELRAMIGRLQAAEFLYEASLFPDLEHALTHEVTYGSLLNERRRALHRQIMASIERLYPDRLPPGDGLTRIAAE
jgi:predicted ATPase